MTVKGMGDLQSTTVVVKLGGAAITNKGVPNTYAEGLEALVAQVSRVYKRDMKNGSRRLVLIHGAGSFGHPPAKQYGVKQGWHANKGAKGGMVATRERMLCLHHRMMQLLNEHGVPVLSVSPYDTVETSNGQLTTPGAWKLASRVSALCQQGFVPVLFGDAVLDDLLGCSILSGDVIMHALATHLKNVTRCVFVTDVHGIYTHDPKTHPKDAKLIRHWHCTRHSLPMAAQDDEKQDSPADVTGAMHGKVQWAVKIIHDVENWPLDVIVSRAKDLPMDVVITRAGSKEFDHVVAGHAPPPDDDKDAWQCTRIIA
ncbi:amino acid kinase family-domain-containing protein [Gongronella butleri]|nr:amino acid kinase family-domain-containing protein [Gongronella butleri]